MQRAYVNCRYGQLHFRAAGPDTSPLVLQPHEPLFPRWRDPVARLVMAADVPQRARGAAPTPARRRSASTRSTQRSGLVMRAPR